MSELRLFTGDPGDGDGKAISLDGTLTSHVEKADIAEVVHHWQDDEGWDGSEVAVLRLKDGRYVAYEGWWGPTGDSFSSDAYGGDGNLYFAKDEDTVVRLGLGDESRRALGISPDSNQEGRP